jgi:hypothetical protein
LLEDLHKPEIRERLKQVWLEPLALDPSLHAARVTKEIVGQLAELAKRLEGLSHHPDQLVT